MIGVYILHLETPLHHSRHYVGMSLKDVEARAALHQQGRAKAKFTRAVHANGIEMILARVFEGADGNFERKLKDTKNVKFYCPICAPGLCREYHPRIPK